MLFDRVQIYGPGDLCSKFNQKTAISALKKFKTFSEYISSPAAVFPTQMLSSYPQSKGPSVDYLCYPNGFHLFLAASGVVIPQVPQTFPFVITSEDGSRCYITCLKFCEQLPAESVSDLKNAFIKAVSEAEEPTTPKTSPRASPNVTPSTTPLATPSASPELLEPIYFQKCICVFSRMPFFSFSR